MSTSIQVGSLVVCIDDRFPPQVWDWCIEVPRRGSLYTVKSITRAPDGVTGIYGVGIALNEIDNSCLPRGGGLFNISRFRPYEEEVSETEKSVLAGTCGSSESTRSLLPANRG